jgi:hypothetical protein
MDHPRAHTAGSEQPTNGIPEGTGPVKSSSGLFFLRFPWRCGRSWTASSKGGGVNTERPRHPVRGARTNGVDAGPARRTMAKAAAPSPGVGVVFCLVVGFSLRVRLVDGQPKGGCRGIPRVHPQPGSTV